jgi:hypothetical protein
MKLGLILECTPDGPDVHVCRRIIKMLNEQYNTNIELAKPATLLNKSGLMQRCGEAAKQFLETYECDRVVIVWDIDPPRKWARENGLVQDQAKISAALTAAKVDQSKVFLAGINRELDSWLTADGDAIRDCISKLRNRNVTAVTGAHRPEENARPKDWLNVRFKERGMSSYQDYQHAKLIIACLSDFREIKRSDTFVGFVRKVADIELQT